MEFCYRVKQAGYSTYFIPDLVFSHEQHGSSNRSFAIINIYKGLVYFYKKHKNILQLRAVKFLLWSKAIGIYTLGRLTNNSYYINTYKEALKVLR
jgi:GT2 family glycosyltransferase